MKKFIGFILVFITTSAAVAAPNPLSMSCNINDQAVALYSFSYTKTGSGYYGSVNLFVKSNGKFAHYFGETTKSLLEGEVSIPTTEGTFTVGPDMKDGTCLIDVKP